MDREDLIVAILKETRDDVKAVQGDLSEIKIDVALNKEDLKVHMKRSDNLEEIVDKLADIIDIKEKEVDAKIAAINEKLSISYLFKLVVTVASGVGAVAGTIYKILQILP